MKLHALIARLIISTVCIIIIIASSIIMTMIVRNPLEYHVGLTRYSSLLHLSIFIRRDLIWYCSVPEDDSFSTRPGAQFKTKGAVAVGFILFGSSFLFVNSHLTAHQENVKDRVKALKKISAMLNLHP